MRIWKYLITQVKSQSSSSTSTNIFISLHPPPPFPPHFCLSLSNSFFFPYSSCPLFVFPDRISLVYLIFFTRCWFYWDLQSDVDQTFSHKLILLCKFAPAPERQIIVSKTDSVLNLGHCQTMHNQVQTWYIIALHFTDYNEGEFQVTICLKPLLPQFCNILGCRYHRALKTHWHGSSPSMHWKQSDPQASGF